LIVPVRSLPAHRFRTADREGDDLHIFITKGISTI
jgi:hypothetical protein